MIHQLDIRRRGDAILIGIALDNAVLDFETSEGLLRECLTFIDAPRIGKKHLCIGRFGEYVVTLNADGGESVSIFVDGPVFEPQRELCAAIWLPKQDLRGVVLKALANVEPPAAPDRGGTG